MHVFSVAYSTFLSADIDECKGTEEVCSGHGCINLVGSYRCECGSGYVFNSISRTCEGKEPVDLAWWFYMVAQSKVQYLHSSETSIHPYHLSLQPIVSRTLFTNFGWLVRICIRHFLYQSTFWLLSSAVNQKYHRDNIPAHVVYNPIRQ